MSAGILLSPAAWNHGLPQIPVYFIEGSELVGVGSRQSPRCWHYFCHGCGNLWARALVDSPTHGHYCSTSLCAECFAKCPYPEISQSRLMDIAIPNEIVDYPIEVYRRDFLILSSRLLEP